MVAHEPLNAPYIGIWIAHLYHKELIFYQKKYSLFIKAKEAQNFWTFMFDLDVFFHFMQPIKLETENLLNFTLAQITLYFLFLRGFKNLFYLENMNLLFQKDMSNLNGTVLLVIWA